MSKTMRAAVVREFGKPLTIEEVAIPTPAADQIPVSYTHLTLPTKA